LHGEEPPGHLPRVLVVLVKTFATKAKYILPLQKTTGSKLAPADEDWIREMLATKRCYASHRDGDGAIRLDGDGWGPVAAKCCHAIRIRRWWCHPPRR
jgi:hypothetical protein